jgi:hypothetical protein
MGCAPSSTEPQVLPDPPPELPWSEVREIELQRAYRQGGQDAYEALQNVKRWRLFRLDKSTKFHEMKAPPMIEKSTQIHELKTQSIIDKSTTSTKIHEWKAQPIVGKRFIDCLPKPAYG